jgi:hypothetical protein
MQNPPQQTFPQGTLSLSDVLTTFKNNVLAISNLTTYIQGQYNNIATAQLFAGPATVVASTLYIASSGAKSHINAINVCNTAGAGATYSMFIVPPGGTAGTANAIFYSAAIAANTTVLWTPGPWIVPAGATIQASASATTVTFMLAGGASV